jgi:hypothetical protein
MDQYNRLLDVFGNETSAKLQNKKLTPYELAKVVSFIEDKREFPFSVTAKNIPVLGITGTGGAGKSSLIDELLLRFHRYYPEKKIALVSVDPTKKKTQGALLGDRIRLGSAIYEQFYIRSLATRDSANELSPEHIRGRTNALMSLQWSVSGVLGPAITGLMLGADLATAWVIVMFVGCFLSIPLFLAMKRSATHAL